MYVYKHTYHFDYCLLQEVKIGGLPNAFRWWPFSKKSFKFWILQIYVTSNMFLNLKISFSNFSRHDCFRQVGFERFERRKRTVFVV